MQRARGASPAEIDKQADGQIHSADGVLIVQRGIAGDLADNNRRRNFRAAVLDLVLGLVPGAQPSKNLSGFYVMPDASFNFDDVDLK